MKKAVWRAKWFKEQTGGMFLISCWPISIFFSWWTVFYHQRLSYNYSSFALISDPLLFTQLRIKDFENRLGEKESCVFLQGKIILKTTLIFEDYREGLSAFTCISCHSMECKEIKLEWNRDDKRVKERWGCLVPSECGSEKLCITFHMINRIKLY